MLAQMTFFVMDRRDVVRSVLLAVMLTLGMALAMFVTYLAVVAVTPFLVAGCAVCAAVAVAAVPVVLKLIVGGLLIAAYAFVFKPRGK